MKIVFTFCILLSSITMNAQQSITGIWNIGNDNTKIEITEDNGVYGAKIVSSDNAKAKIGSEFLKDVKSVGGEWEGKLYNAKKNKWYDVVLKEKGDQLMATVDAGMMSKTLEWTKG
ncbi:MAG: DUF2147 domain-containing protein [Bacteroidetes bacterium]|nr:DUF2147 domain-containing protein [Bacteroidota bacterium]